MSTHTYTVCGWCNGDGETDIDDDDVVTFWLTASRDDGELVDLGRSFISLDDAKRAAQAHANQPLAWTRSDVLTSAPVEIDA